MLDTLALAREMHPGQRNNLDALCKRYGIDNSHRELHGALLDARILADVYLAMTGGQSALALDDAPRRDSRARPLPRRPAMVRRSSWWRRRPRSAPRTNNCRSCCTRRATGAAVANRGPRATMKILSTGHRRGRVHRFARCAALPRARR